jgi:hypothetical protein
MATLLETLETTCASLSRKVRVEYATLEEANAVILDRLKTSDFPVCLIIPFETVDGDRAHTRINSTAEVEALFLDRFTTQQTLDKSTVQIENLFCAPMRALSREFVNRLDTTDIIHEDGISSVRHQSTFNGLTDAHLYGCWSTFTIKFSEDINTHICD